MTVCVTNTPLPGLTRCTIPGAHRVTCHDHEGWAERPGLCRGCLPREAEYGHLCSRCYFTAVNAVAAWADFKAKLDATGGRVVSPDGTGSSNALGYSNLSMVFLAVDECERHLKSRNNMTVDAWIETEKGAADAVMFAAAAANAWTSLEVTERKTEITRERCPNCDVLTTFGHNTHDERGATVVTCSFCGTELARVRPDINRWKGSATCEHLLHANCDAVDCRCDCHLLGARSRPAGAQALWDADQHTIETSERSGTARRAFRVPTGRRNAEGEWIWETRETLGTLRTRAQRYRADWTITDALTIHPTSEEKAA